MEGLNTLISEEKNRGCFKGVKIASNILLTHLLFVDDVLIFTSRAISDSSVMDGILKVFCKATGMKTNQEKTTLTVAACSPNESTYVEQRFPFRKLDIKEGLKYLGFRLKPNNYKNADWSWLVANIESRINLWHHRWLSRAGRLVLIKSVLESIPVYWMSLVWICIGVMHKIQ